MYKEFVKPDKKTKIFMISLLVGALVLALLTNWLITLFNLPYRSLYQLLILIIASIGVYSLIRNVLSEYEYRLADNNFSIISRLGDVERLIVTIDTEDIKCIVSSVSDLPFETKILTKYNAAKNIFSSSESLCIFAQGEKLCSLKFEPSKKLYDMLKGKISNM